MNWKKVALVFFGIVLAVYMVMAMTIFNAPDEEVICKGVSINMANGHVKGFLTEDDVKRMLTVDHINPQGQSMPHVNVRIIEEILRGKELIDSVECYKGQDGFVCIDIYQRIPVVRVMSQDGANYYVDNHGKPMPGTDYPCNLIVATGHITKAYAEKWLVPMVNIILQDPFWQNQIEQLNVLGDGSVELVPRVGEHIAYLGQPNNIDKKLDRLRKFYRYGLSQAGWNKYSRVSVEFDNQIVCIRK